MRAIGSRVQGGFSLLEVLLAALIFATVVGSVAASWKYQERSMKKYRNRNAARLMAEQELGRLTAHNYTNLEDAARDTTLTLNREVDGVVTPMSFDTVTNIKENKERTLKDVTITVGFSESNEEKSFTLRTRVYRSE